MLVIQRVIDKLPLFAVLGQPILRNMRKWWEAVAVVAPTMLATSQTHNSSSTDKA